MMTSSTHAKTEPVRIKKKTDISHNIGRLSPFPSFHPYNDTPQSRPPLVHLQDQYTFATAKDDIERESGDASK